MKKQLLRKIAASVSALALIASMNATAFAAELSSGVSITNELTVNINKTLTVSNPDLTSVDGPGMSYSYAISPAVPSDENGGTAVTDANNNTGTVHEGPQGGVTLVSSTVSFPVGTPVNASGQGTANTKSFTASSDLSRFTSPGIYRYKITETMDPADASSIGVSDTGDRDRYLDVYIENGETGLQVAGYTLHDKYNNKTDGFNGGSAGAGQPFTGAAKFETVNIVLENEVSGNMGNRNNQFPFEGKAADNGRSFYAKKGSAPESSSTDMIAGAASGSTVATTLANNEKYYISGLSKAALIDYTETNNTPDAYSVTITGGTPSGPTQVAQGGTKTMGQTAVSDSAVVKFTNRLDTVTPTGVVLRFGAPLLVIALGAVLMLMRLSGGIRER